MSFGLFEMGIDFNHSVDGAFKIKEEALDLPLINQHHRLGVVVAVLQQADTPDIEAAEVHPEFPCPPHITEDLVRNPPTVKPLVT